MTTTPASAGGMECLLNRSSAGNNPAKINQSLQSMRSSEAGKDQPG